MLTQPEKSIEELINSASPSSTRSRRIQQNGLTYSTRASLDSLQGTQFPQEVLSPNIAYQLIHDQLQFDGNPQMNGATFLTTWMEKEARDLINENLAINFADQDEYPATLKLHGRCVRYLSHLWKIPADKEAVGTAVCGSSEGIMLGGLAMKWRWRERRQAEGKDTKRPNIVFGANSQVALEKFARYFD
ncbi:glutamate decarboxylase gad1, partial [Spiromyces aspiralis]